MAYKISLEAEEDLIRIYRYGEIKFGTEQALNYYFGLIANFERISDNPYQFASVAHIKPGYRRCVYKADTIYFRVSEEVEIMAIVGRQDFL